MLLIFLSIKITLELSGSAFLFPCIMKSFIIFLLTKCNSYEQMKTDGLGM
jgi:hypothetical protein